MVFDYYYCGNTGIHGVLHGLFRLASAELVKFMEKYEEFKIISQGWGWFLLIFLSGILIGWGMLLMCVIQDRPRQWHFGAKPQIPAESVYSTSRAAQEANVPRQIEQVPGTGWDRSKGAQL